MAPSDTKHLHPDDDNNDELGDGLFGDGKKSFSKQILGRTLKHTLSAVDKAREVADAAMQTVDDLTSSAVRGISGTAHFTGDAVRGIVSGTTELAGDVALAMARTALGNTTLTLPLPAQILNAQIRKRLEQNPNADIDHLTIDCGNDRLHLIIDGHYRRMVYTLRLDFNVLEYRMENQKVLRLRQISEGLDVQLREANVLANWAARKVSGKAFELVNKLPIPSLINHIIRDVPGIQQESHRVWVIDLEKAGVMDFVNNRSWMVEKLISLTDFSVLPGLNILRESRDLMQQLVDQFEVRDLRVRSGRLEIDVGIDRD